MPLGLEFYTVLALVAALALGFSALIRQIRDPHGADPRWRRAALHFTLPLVLALAVLFPPYGWVLPIGFVTIYFWQMALPILIVVLLRSIPQIVLPGARRSRLLYVEGVLYLLLLLVSLVYDDKATILTVVSFLLLLHLFAGFRTLLAAGPPATPPTAG